MTHARKTRARQRTATGAQEFGVGLIPFEDDVLSLELPNAFRDVYLDHDRTVHRTRMPGVA